MSYTNYRDMARAIANREEFSGNSVRGVWLDRSQYAVFSYGTQVAEYDAVTTRYYLNARKYSQTTSRLQNIVRRAWRDRNVFESVHGVGAYAELCEAQFAKYREANGLSV